MIKKLTNTHKMLALIGLLITATLVRADEIVTEQVQTTSFAPETVATIKGWSKTHILNQEIERLNAEVRSLELDKDSLLSENDELQAKVNTLLTLLAKQKAVIQTFMIVRS